MADEVIAAIQCPRCDYKSPEGLPKSVALAVFAAHVTQHAPTPPTPAPAPPVSAPAHRGPKLERPKVEMGVSMEEWNIFTRRWDAYVIGEGLDAANCSSQLLQCAGQELGDIILKSYPTILSQATTELQKTMKSLAVISVSLGVVRTELMQMTQNRDESFRSFAAKVRGKAETCGYINQDCPNKCDFTQSIIKDVLIAGIYDMDIRREILSMDKILQKSTNDIISLVEAKETARNALPPIAAGMSTFKKSQRSTPNQPRQQQQTPGNPPLATITAPCPTCGTTYSLFTEGKSGWNKKPHPKCIDCYRSS